MIDWTDLGPPTTHIPTPAFFIDVKDTALAARVSEAPTANDDGFQRLESGLLDSRIGYITWPEPAFPRGDQLLYTTGALPGGGGISAGNMGFDFSQPVFGFGMNLIYGIFQVDVPTRIEAFDNSGSSLGFFDVNAPGSSTPGSQFQSGPAEFFGISSDVRNIASILYSPLATPNGGMVVSTPLVETGVSPSAPDGLSPTTAIMPSQGTPRPEDGAWVFEDVAGTGRWFDPPLISGYEYEVTDGLSNFITVQLPTTIGDADNQFVIEDAINGTAIVNGGYMYTFATPVDLFTVTGINPLVDGEDPLAFPTYLSFDQLTVSFTQTPIAIPEPASLLLLGLGCVTLAGNRRR